MKGKRVKHPRIAGILPTLQITYLSPPLKKKKFQKHKDHYRKYPISSTKYVMKRPDGTLLLSTHRVFRQ